MSDLAARLADLSPQRRELLLRQLAKRQVETREEERIPRQPRDTGRFPVSFSQLREWILDRLEPGSAAYNIPGAARLRGPLAPGLVAWSVNEVVRRHESLRTTFLATDGEPVQVVAPALALTVPLLDLSALPAAPREAEAERLALAELRRPFDLARGPLLRVSIVRAAPAEHNILYTMHHIVSDGWSLGLFWRELSVLYRGAATGAPLPRTERSERAELPELPVQYADYAVWQRSWLKGEALEQQLAYWRERLAGLPPLLTLPTDRPRPPVQTTRGGRRAVPFPLPLPRALKALARRQGASLFMTLLAGYEALLARSSGQDDVAVGTYTGNRGRAELESLIGFFINTLVLRGDLSANPTFKDLLEQAREVTLEAFAHQELPFEKLLEALQVNRDLSHTPLFQALLVLQNFPQAVALSAESELTQLTPEDEHANFDLALWLSEGGEPLTGILQYNADLFDAATIDRMAGHLVNLLGAAAEHPERRIFELPLTSPAEREQLVGELSGSATPAAPAEVPVHALFAAQAERTPDAPAVEADGRALAYRELRERAGQLARHLRGLGVGPETIVGLAAERSPEALVGMLGVLEAGGAYLPLDPAYPAERLDFMLADSRAPVLLAGRGLEDRFRDGAAAGRFRVVPLSPGEGGWPGEGRGPGAVALSPDHPAYVLYTSGSTGRPKGVVVPHRALSAYALDAAAAYEVQPDDRVLQFASISFDTSAEEIYPSLIRGATLVLRPESMAGTADRFLRELERLEITLLNLPTAYWHELVAGLIAGAGGGGESAAPLPPRLRRVVIGGERALPDRLLAWQAGTAEGRVRLVNTYGPTETTIVATRAELPPPVRFRQPPPEVPIGRPIRGAAVYCVDRFGEPVPVGFAGELWIGGAGLARGYLHRPELTAAAFVPDPFATPAAAGGRLYRSGDLARFRPDGRLEFVGRVDAQVKVRGFRVEPAEVESVLARHPLVRTAAVVARADASSALQLVAYVAPAPAVEQSALSTTELRRFLASRLPEHLIPAAFVVLDALPLTGSGKVDRRALPEPQGDRPLLEREYAAPESPVEEALCAIWAAALGIARVGVDDNFFELGGHSLLATQVIAQIRERLDVELPLITLFQMPTVAQLSVQVEETILDQIEKLADGEVQELL